MNIIYCNSILEFKKLTFTETNSIIIYDQDTIYYPLQAFPPVTRTHDVHDMMRGLIFGQCIADATGLAGEFMQSWQVRENYSFGQLSPKTRISDEHRDTWLKGDWSDDSDNLILVLLSLNSEKPDVVFLEKLKYWYYNGFPELGDVAGCGIGNTIRNVILGNKSAEQLSSTSNGSIMRSAVVGLLYTNNWATVKDLAIKLCKTTHTHPKSVAACVYITSLVWNMCNGIHDVTRLLKIAYEQSVDQLKQKHIAEFKKATIVTMLSDFVMDPVHGRGYVYRPLMAAVYCLKNWYKGFEYLINEITFKGGDTDTNCAVAGAVLGVYIGYSQLPAVWVEELLHKEWLERQIKFIQN